MFRKTCVTGHLESLDNPSTLPVRDIRATLEVEELLDQ